MSARHERRPRGGQRGARRRAESEINALEAAPKRQSWAANRPAAIGRISGVVRQLFSLFRLPLHRPALA